MLVHLMADYEQFLWIVAAGIGALLLGCFVIGAVAAGVLAAVTKDRRQLWWTPAFTLIAFLLFVAGVLVFRGP